MQRRPSISGNSGPRIGASQLRRASVRHEWTRHATANDAPASGFCRAAPQLHLEKVSGSVSCELFGKEIMSSGSGLGPVHTLASLPSPLDPAKGRIYAEPVCSLVGAKLRKRHEIVVSIDGEAVNIYDVSSHLPIELEASNAMP